MSEPKTGSKAADSIADAKAAFPDCAAGAKEACPATEKPAKSTRERQCVKQIKASTAGTNGVRTVDGKPRTRPDNVLRPSSSSDKSLTGNKPIVLIRGCKDVVLQAVTTPPDTAVTWKVEANHTANAAPGIDSQGSKAVLSTDVAGSFSVIATLGGCKVVWNVVFVWVNVDVKSSHGPRTTAFYADNGSSNTHIRFRSGKFTDDDLTATPFTGGEFAWADKLKVKLIGGGDDQTLGVEKVKLNVLQHCPKDTLTAHYGPPPAGATALEKPKGGLPILDSTNDKSPFLTDSGTFSLTHSSKVDFEVATGDSPGSEFPVKHEFTSQPIQSISGVFDFRTAIASVSDDAQNTIMVHASTTWTADYGGIVDASGRYVPRGAKTTAAAAWLPISESTGGQDAGEAHMETFEPRFNDTLFGTDHEWNPARK